MTVLVSLWEVRLGLKREFASHFIGHRSVIYELRAVFYQITTITYHILSDSLASHLLAALLER